MHTSPRRTRTGRLTFTIVGSLAVLGCGDGLRVGLVETPGTGGHTDISVDAGDTGGAQVPPGAGGTSGGLEIDGAPATPVAVTAGATEQVANLVVKNAGTTVATNLRISLNPLPTPFFLAQDACSGNSLDPGQTCPFKLMTRPVSRGRESVNVVAAAAESMAITPVSAAVSGLLAVIDAPTLLSAPVGCPSPETVVRVTNDGGLTSILALPLFSAGLRDGQQDTCAAGTGLPPGKGCVLSVRAWPRAEGPSTESVTVSGSPGGTAQVNLKALGLSDYIVAPLALALTSLDGGPVTGTITVSVGSSARGAFDLSIIGSAEFTAKGACSNPIPACSSCQVLVAFTPLPTRIPGTSSMSGSITPTATLTIYSAGLATTVELMGYR